MYPLSLQYLVTARIFLLTAGMLTSRRQEKPYSSLCLSYGFIYVHCIVPSVCEHGVADVLKKWVTKEVLLGVNTWNLATQHIDRG